MVSEEEVNASRSSTALDIAILGTRGIPASYGGFETFAQELSSRLVLRGHQVTVYARNHYVSPDCQVYQGVRVQRLPAIRHKYLETVSHTLLSVLHVLFHNFDIVLICNAANAFMCWIPRLKGQRVAINVDGIERHRKKWNFLGKAFYRVNEWLATRFPNRVVTDARVIQDYYRQKYGCFSTFIPYGADVGKLESRAELDRLGLENQGYLLYVSRLEPENNAHHVIEAYLRTNLEHPLVIVGDAPYNASYIQHLKRMSAGTTVLMPGAIYGTGYRELLSHCRCYLHGTEVGGTHPALIEAMGAGSLVIVNDTVENREVAGRDAFFCRFSDHGTLSEIMIQVVSAPERFVDHRRRLQERIRTHYQWEAVVDQYEDLFIEMASAGRRSG